MSFWGKKFAQQNGAPLPAPSTIPSHLLPQGLVRPPAQQYSPVGAPSAPAAPYGGWQPNTVDPTKMAEVLPIWHWEGNPRGGAGETQMLGNCPACGSTNFFSRASESKINERTGQRAVPAPECFDCGYPREQGVLGAHTITGAGQARQAALPSAPPGSVASLGRS